MAATATVLELLIDRLLELLDVPAAERDGRWAYRGCVLSQEIHLAVWRSEPERQDVRDRVMPLLRGLLEALEDLATRPVKQLGEFGELIGDFAANDRDRIRNLSNYVEGKQSAFAVASRLRDPLRACEGRGEDADKGPPPGE